MQKLRCALCGVLYTAAAPEDTDGPKYAATAGSMIGLLKYGAGMPFNRSQRLQGSLGIPLPAATQWDIVHAKANRIQPAHDELIRLAAQGHVVYSDDTTNKILEFMGERARKTACQGAVVQEVAPEDQHDEEPLDKETNKNKTRTGLFTTGIVSQYEDHQIAVFFTGRQHAGENLADVLRQRARALEPPIHMSDGLSRNIPKELETIMANCMTHARRYFVDVAEMFPDQSRHVVDALTVIYANDAIAREQGLSPEERLVFHQTHSGPTMDAFSVVAQPAVRGTIGGTEFGPGESDHVHAQPLAETDALSARTRRPT